MSLAPPLGMTTLFPQCVGIGTQRKVQFIWALRLRDRYHAVESSLEKERYSSRECEQERSRLRRRRIATRCGQRRPRQETARFRHKPLQAGVRFLDLSQRSASHGQDHERKNGRNQSEKTRPNYSVRQASSRPTPDTQQEDRQGDNSNGGTGKKKRRTIT
jgi:hypothetical protein